MVRMWNGGRGVSDMYAELLAAAFRVPFAAGKRGAGGTGGASAACGDRPAGAGCAPGSAVPHPSAACGPAPGETPVPPGQEEVVLEDAAGRSLALGDGGCQVLGRSAEVLIVAIDRRRVLAGGGVLVPLAAMEQARHTLLGSLAADRASADIDEWQEIAWDYGLGYNRTPPAELLDGLLVDLAVLGEAVQRRRAGPATRELHRVAALLATFAALTVADLGDLRSARRWWRTARQAADASGDVETRLWTRGREVVRAVYEQRPTPAVLGLVAEAEAVSAGAKAPPAALPVVLCGKALAATLPGRGRDAETALCELRENFGRLPARIVDDTDSLFGWCERALHFTESYVYSQVGDYARAEEAQAAARALCPATDPRVLVMVELHRALCLVRTGDVAPGVERAHAAVIGLPREQYIRPIVDLGGKVLDAVPTAERDRDGVRAFRTHLGGYKAA